MSIGKYSPTVFTFYDENQNWFKENCANQDDIYDRDGYDSYGYDENGIDRDGRDETYYNEKSWAEFTDEELRGDN